MLALHWPLYILIAICSLVVIGCVMLLIGSLCSVLARDNGYAEEYEEDTTFTGTLTMWFFLVSVNIASLMFSLFLVGRNLYMFQDI